MATFAQTHGVSIKQAWWKYHKANPHVYELFEELALRAISKGKKKLSAKMIVNVIRWEHYLETKDTTPFRINDAWHAYYARLFMHYHPQFGGIFETRELRS